MLNFTVGPVMSPPEVLKQSSRNSPYFRTPEFSQKMLRSESLMLELLGAPESSRCTFLTASGTGAMEAAVMGVLRPKERVVVINGGSFGQRFADLCQLHGHGVDEVRAIFGMQVTRDALCDAARNGATALLVNMCETSSGVLYDMELVADVCRERGMLLIVDAVSAFIADELDMGKLGADVVLTGSQKALACHPGVSVVALSDRAQARVRENPEPCMYLSLREALENGARGQTPWTPAVTTLLELYARLETIETRGIAAERDDIVSHAHAVREAVAETSLELVAESPSNCVTALMCPRRNAREIVETAKDRYGIWLCPNGGAMADEVFRIGHIGDIRPEDEELLLGAIREMSADGLF